jgi:cytochrome P450
MHTWADGTTRDLHQEMTTATLGIIAKVLFDTDQVEVAQEVGRALAELTNFFVSPFNYSPIARFLPTPAAFHFHRAVRRLNRVIYDLIQKHRAKKQPGNDLLSRLLAKHDDGAPPTDQELRDELVTLFLAGLETTALALSFCLYLLARHPDAGTHWRNELASVLGDRLPTTADVPKLTYTDWVVRESMRLYPPAWMVAREALEECEIGGYPVAKGIQLWMPQWVVHRDPRWFNEADEFRPERWDKDLAKHLPRGAYFPFGDGPRVCIGNHFAMLEAVLLLASIGQRFRFSLPDGFELSLAPSVTLRPANGLPMVLRPAADAGMSRPAHR